MGGVSVRATIESGGWDEWVGALDPLVAWVGVSPGQLCRSRDEVVATFRQAMDSGVSGSPEVVAEADGMLVVDPHVQPPHELYPELHHVFSVRDERVVELRDYPSRAAALAAVGLE